MTEQNRSLAHNWFEEVWNQANPDAIDKYFAPDGHCYGFPDPTSVLSRDEYKAIHDQFLKSFSNLRVEVQDVIVEADRMAIRWVVRMDHTGDALGIPPTGKPVVMGGSSFCHIRDGQITEGWNFMDFTKVLQQLQAAA